MVSFFMDMFGCYVVVVENTEDVFTFPFDKISQCNRPSVVERKQLSMVAKLNTCCADVLVDFAHFDLRIILLSDLHVDPQRHKLFWLCFE